LRNDFRPKCRETESFLDHEQSATALERLDKRPRIQRIQLERTDHFADEIMHIE
jgi:hypothetical protein